MQFKKRQQKPRRTASAETVSFGSVLKSALLAVPIAIAVGLLLILCATAILLTTKNPDKYHTVAGAFLIYLTALIGGAIATRFHHRRAPLFCGIAMGFLMLLLLLLVSLVLPDSNHTYTSALNIGLHALLFPAAMVGAILSAREKKEKNKHRLRTKH